MKLERNIHYNNKQFENKHGNECSRRNLMRVAHKLSDVNFTFITSSCDELL
jgi:hypothetical protein